MTSVGPDPLRRPSGGTMAAEAGLPSKPAPGTLSKSAASSFNAASYGDGLIFASGIAPSGFIFPAASSGNGELAATTRTSICSGNVQPAASYGRSGGPPGY